MLDLGSKAHLAAIAKCILALANRDPVTAASPLEKHPTGSSLRSLDSRSLPYTGRCTERSSCDDGESHVVRVRTTPRRRV